MKALLLAFVGTVGLIASACAQDADLKLPATAVAGEPASIKTSGSGAARFYLIGPATSIKQDVELGKDVRLASNDVNVSGRYVAIICASSCRSHEFFVVPSEPASLTFLVIRLEFQPGNLIRSAELHWHSINTRI